VPCTPTAASFLILNGEISPLKNLFHEQSKLYFGLRAEHMLSVLSTNSLFALMTYAFEFSASVISHFDVELELELIQTQTAQKPMMRAEVHAHAMRASQNRKKEVRRGKEV